MKIAEGEIIPTKDRFSRAFVVSDNLTDALKEEVLREFASYLSNKMSKENRDSEVPEHYIENELKITVPITVVPNAVPMYFWGNKKKSPKKNPIKKPRIVYTGSPTHYSNQEKLLGDFENSWKDFVIKNVLEDKIQFICMGDLPWFFEGIKDKIGIIPWVNSYQYHLAVKDVNADFAIGPLVKNNFNYYLGIC